MKNEEKLEEYKIFGNTVEDIAIKYGIFLVLWGGLISFLSQSGSITSWIPGIIGFPLFLLGWLSKIRPKLKKIAMHIAVLIGFFGFVGGFDVFKSGFSSPYAGGSKLMLLVTGFLFCYLCIQSFLFVRKQKKELEEL